MTVPTCAHSRYPVAVTTPSGERLAGVRMVLTVPTEVEPARLMCWTRPGDPAVDEAVDLAGSFIGHTRIDWTFPTDQGVYTVHPGRGGCCGPMSGWQPFDPMIMGALP